MSRHQPLTVDEAVESNRFEPLLATAVDFSKVNWSEGWVASPKLDGIRALVIGGILLSRKLKTIPNRKVQEMFSHPRFNLLDGELIVGAPTSKTVYHDTYSGVMSEDGEPDVTYYVFDHMGSPQSEYHERHAQLMEMQAAGKFPANIQILPQVEVTCLQGLETLEEQWLEQGYEGVMLRRDRGPKSVYKFGRATPNQGNLLKLKRFEDAEANIIGFEELMKNGNEATKNASGHTERSSHKEGMIPMNTLGALICKHPETGVEFSIGTGFTAAQRAQMWKERDQLLHRVAKYKSFPIGVKDAPRFPVFLGLRHPIDMPS